MRFTILLILLFNISCRQNVKVNSLSYIQIKDLELEEKLQEFDCKVEYDFARLFLYSEYFNEVCTSAFCSKTFIKLNPSKRLLSTNIRLDMKKTNPIRVSGDTIIFKIIAFIDDSLNCRCFSDINGFLPAEITIKRKSNEILFEETFGGIGWFPTKSDVSKVLTNPEMLIIVKKNRDYVNPWFYDQLVKYGYLK
jgi:hypothetical protein